MRPDIYTIARQFTLASALLILSSADAFATNGYFTHGIGTKNKSLAGAGSAMPDEALATAINPAAAAYVGTRFEVGVSIFSPSRSYESSTSAANGLGGAFTIVPAKLESSNKSFPIPYAGKVWQHDETTAYAISFYGRGGMNTKYRRGAAILDPDGLGPRASTQMPGTFGDGTTGVDLSQAFLDVTYARHSGPVSWGVSLVLAAQAFEAKGLSNFAPFTEAFARSNGASLPEHLTNNGHDYSFGYGLKAGVIWEASQALNLAASYQSETYMQKFDRYADLFADSGSFNVPANARIAASWRATDRTTLHFDIDRTFFSEVESIGNSAANLASCPSSGLGGTDVESCLGGENGAGFGWEDVTTYHLGVETYVSALPRWTWRAGYSRANSPIRSTEVLFNVLAPGVVEEHYTFGASRTLDNNKSVNVSFMYAPSARARGANPFDPTQTIELEMHQFEFEFGFSW